MVDARNYFRGKWLKAMHIEHVEPVVCTITGVKVGKYKDTDKDKDSVLCIQFAEFGPPYGANDMALKRLMEFFGPDTDNWVGGKVTLVTEEAQRPDGTRGPAIRIAEDQPTQSRRPKRPAARKRKTS